MKWGMTSYGKTTLIQMVGIILFAGLITSENWLAGFLAIIGIFIALDATEMMAVKRMRGDNTDLFYRKR